MFVDRVRIHVQAGHGGAGVVSFQRGRGRPRGRPDGGSGGSGGDVVLAADDRVATLLRYYRRPHWKADSGTHGAGGLRHGRRGGALVLGIPLGTLVRDEAGTLIADLVETGASIVVARGGRGGRGNAEFASREFRAPTFAEQGEYGEAFWIGLELKLLADAALIGFPNAGKSTLISRVSAARPKVADYPFTTVEPNLGVVDADGREFVLADIPGLIEGAAEGKGLGHEFLRHAERARALVILLDPSPLQTITPEAQYDILLTELEAHSSDLVARPRIVAVNKMDLTEAGEQRQGLAEWAARRGLNVHFLSAVTGAGIEGLVPAVAGAVDEARRAAPEREGFVLHRPVPAGFTVSREGDIWVVTGRQAERAVNLSDLTDPQAADFAARRLTRAGVDDALRSAGARPGDDVRIGDLVFTFAPDEAHEERGGRPAPLPDADDGGVNPPAKPVQA